MSRTALDVQRDFALSCGLRSQIIWDSLGPDQANILNDKIKALLPLPINGEQSQNSIERMRNNIFKSVWEQRKYTNRTLLSTVIYILVVEKCPINVARSSKKFSCHPVFRTRKCLNNKTKDSHGCCMIFIDEVGRVYRNWKHFVETNVLPKGIMIAPVNGIYTFDDKNEVSLMLVHTPAALPKGCILNETDTVATVGGLVATVPIMASLAFPIAAPVMAAAAVVTLTTAAYSTVRSAMQLSDRGSHEQSIALTDRDARGDWLGLACGTIGLGATGATTVLKCAATAGKNISMSAKIVVNSMNVSSILLSGSTVANNVFDIFMKIHDKETITKINVLQLASSLIVFTHSVNNFRIALNASEVENGNRRSIAVRSQLTKQMRDLINKITGNSAKISEGRPTNFSTPANSFDIIRLVNDVPFKDVLMGLHQQNPNLQPRRIIGDAFIKAVTELLKQFSDGDQSVYVKQLADYLGGKFVQHIVNPSSLIDVLNAMTKYFCDKTVRLLLNLTRTFIEEYADSFDQSLTTFMPTESVLYKMLMHCIKNYKTFSYEYIESKSGEILVEVENYFESLVPFSNGINAKKCDTCMGSFSVCQL